MGFINSQTGDDIATLDMDATLIETHKEQATYCFRKYKAYQPLTTYWYEADLVVHSEFRDGNVPAGHQQLRVLRESLENLPSRVDRVMLRSDTAGYQQELLRYCAEGRHERFGVIEFAVGVDVTEAFRGAVAEVAEEEWQKLYRRVDDHLEYTGQQYAEVCFVPNWVGHSLNNPEYRFLAIRELLRKPPLPGMEAQLELSAPMMEMSDGAWYKVSGIVTNRDIAGDELIWWYRQRCGKGEEVHGVLKEDLAGGRMPSGLFGANAAWWAIAVLTFNLNSAMKRLALGGQWVRRRMKALRFGIICLPGRVVSHARRLVINISRDHPSFDLLCRGPPEDSCDGQLATRSLNRAHQPHHHTASANTPTGRRCARTALKPLQAGSFNTSHRLYEPAAPTDNTAATDNNRRRRLRTTLKPIRWWIWGAVTVP